MKWAFVCFRFHILNIGSLVFHFKMLKIIQEKIVVSDKDSK